MMNFGDKEYEIKTDWNIYQFNYILIAIAGEAISAARLKDTNDYFYPRRIEFIQHLKTYLNRDLLEKYPLYKL